METMNKSNVREGRILVQYLNRSQEFEPTRYKTQEERYQYLYNHISGELIDRLNMELYSLKIVSSYLEELINKGGKAGIELSYCEANNLGMSIYASIKNIERAMKKKLKDNAED